MCPTCSCHACTIVVVFSPLLIKLIPNLVFILNIFEHLHHCANTIIQTLSISDSYQFTTQQLQMGFSHFYYWNITNRKKKDFFLCIILKLFTAQLHTDTPKQICKHLQLSCLHHRLHETQAVGRQRRVITRLSRLFKTLWTSSRHKKIAKVKICSRS